MDWTGLVMTSQPSMAAGANVAASPKTYVRIDAVLPSSPPLSALVSMIAKKIKTLTAPT